MKDERPDVGTVKRKPLTPSPPPCRSARSPMRPKSPPTASADRVCSLTRRVGSHLRPASAASLKRCEDRCDHDYAD